jgi:signal transduction histidine kinase
MKTVRRHLDLQAKISLVLVAVILPTFVIVTVAQNKFTLPILEEEIRQIGINSGKTLAAEIDSARMLSTSNPTPTIENSIQEILYTQPDIVRIDVVARDAGTGGVKLVASNVEEDPNTPFHIFPIAESVNSEFKVDESGSGLWEIYVPIEHRSRDPRGPRRLLGTVRVVVSTKLVSRMVTTLWKTTATAASFSVVSLLLVLSYFLRKTIANDRLLKLAESQNMQLTEQLHDAQRQLMNNEKLAVMGQLTASFAHEIGTPLNAVGGHLQLLREEIPSGGGKVATLIDERLDIIYGQLNKIEEIVKGFLQSTAKPTSQKQLVDLNRLVDKTLGIVNPRIDLMKVTVKRRFDRNMGPVRIVPLDLEQILLNLLNNSLDSIYSKASSKSWGRDKERSSIELVTEVSKSQGKEWAEMSVYDTGEGISKLDLKNVLKPFFTTKRPGEGTGLGLTICQQLVHKYGGEFLIDSKEGAWTRVTIRLPYHSNV